MNRDLLTPSPLPLKDEKTTEAENFLLIYQSREIFVAFLLTLFTAKENGECVYDRCLIREQEKIRFTLRIAFESVLLFERMLCLFYSQNPVYNSDSGLPWVAHFPSQLEGNLLPFSTINELYLRITPKLFPELCYLLLPCVPLHYPQPQHTNTLRWSEKYVRLPDGYVGVFWEAELLHKQTHSNENCFKVKVKSEKK
jgi:hypothetical protein